MIDARAMMQGLKTNALYKRHYFTGRFESCADVIECEFSIQQKQTVYLFTTSYGLNAPHGVNTGFILWRADTEDIVNASEDGRITSITYPTGDGSTSETMALGLNDAALFRPNLPPGRYIVTIMPTFDGQAADSMHFRSIADLKKYKGKFRDVPVERLGEDPVYKFHAVYYTGKM